MSWLIVSGEKFLAGGRLYHDIMETNPPMTLLMYLPPIWLAGVTGIAAELTVHAWVVLWAVISLLLVRHLAAPAGVTGKPGQFLLLGVAAFVLLVLPARCFGEREQFAVAGLLPWLTLLAARWNGWRPGFALAIVIGVLAGLVLTIKPYFALMMLLPALAMLAARRRVLDHVTPENIAAGLVAVAYLGFVAVAYPEFLTETMELNRLVYLPNTLTPRDLMLAPATGLAMMLGILLLLVRGWLAPPLPQVLATAAIGGFIVYMIQAKGWAYHQLPTFMLGFTALAAGIAMRHMRADADPRPRPIELHAHEAVALLASLALIGFFAPRLFSEHTHTKALETEIRKYSPAPSLMIGSADLGMHFPLVRRTNARWVYRTASLWMTEGATRVLPGVTDPAHRARLQRLIRLERTNFAADAVKHRPDMLGFAYIDAERNMLAWARETPALARLLEDYRQVAIADDILLMVRKDLAPERQAQQPR